MLFLSSLLVNLKSEIIVEGLFCALKGKFPPRDPGYAKGLSFYRLIPGPEFSPNHFSRIDHDDDGRLWIGINIQQGTQPYLDIRFLLGLPDSRLPDTLPAVNVAAREDPFAQGGFHAAAQQNDTPFYGKNGSRNDLRIEIEYKGALRAHQPLRLYGFHPPLFQTTATARAEAVLHMAMAMGMFILMIHTIFLPQIRLKQKRRLGMG